MSLAIGLVGCDFLDVEPKGQVPEDRQFEDVDGFKSAMIGVYASMATTDLYGCNLTYGFLDVVGQVFRNSSSTVYVGASNFDYTNQEVRTYCNTIWAQMYSTIAQVNNVIYNLDKTRLSSSDFNIIRGEAYALRAFLHFDIARLYAQDRANYPAASRLPYSYSFDLANKEIYSISDYYANILADLDQAEAYLEDEVYDINDATLSTYPVRAHQYTYYFNKYAVWALKARVYYTMGDDANAQKYAQKVIDEKTQFALSANTIAALKEAQGFPGQREMIFGISTNNLSQTVYNHFRVGSQEEYLLPRADLKTRYNITAFTATNTDNRYTVYYEESSSTTQFIRFISTQNEVDRGYLQGLPLIRLPEMYYILAESLYDTDFTAAKAALDAVRQSRGLEPIDSTSVATKEDFLNEMIIERYREMSGEGQVFFALKHYNKAFTRANGTTTVQPSAAVFVFPLPDDEVEFGNINN